MGGCDRGTIALAFVMYGFTWRKKERERERERCSSIGRGKKKN